MPNSFYPHPYRHILFPDEQSILWAPSLKGLRLKSSKQLNSLLHNVFDKLEKGLPLNRLELSASELLLQKGYLLFEDSKPITDKKLTSSLPPIKILGNGLIIYDGPTGKHLAQTSSFRQPYVLYKIQAAESSFPPIQNLQWTWVIMDRFDYHTLMRWWELALTQDLQALLFCLVGDGDCGWIYIAYGRPTPCLPCFLRRWFSFKKASAPLDKLIEMNTSILWEPIVTPQQIIKIWNQSLNRLSPDIKNHATSFLISSHGISRQPITPVPLCQQCRGPTVYPKRFYGPLGILKTTRPWWGQTYPYLYASECGSTQWVTGGTAPAGAGCGFTRKQARRCAEGEALERYSASFIPDDAIISLEAEQCTIPKLYTEHQYSMPSFPYIQPHKKDYLPCTSITPIFLPHLGQKAPGHPEPSLYVPINFVYFRENGLPINIPLGPQTTLGLCCATNLRAALTGAALELIERDAAAYFWINFCNGHNPAYKIDLPLSELTSELTARSLIPPTGFSGECRFYRLPSIAATVIMCLLITDKKQPIFGLGCSPNFIFALRKAFREAYHNLVFLTRNPDPPPPLQPTGFVEFLRYYYHNPARFPWANLKSTPPDGDNPLASTVQGDPLTCLLDNGFRLYYKDITPPDVRAMGYTVVRLLAPELLYIPDHHLTWPMGVKRWKKEIKLSRLPELPHPFG